MSGRQRSISPWLFIGLPERWTLCSVRGFISTFSLSLTLSLALSFSLSLCPQRSLTGRARVRCRRAAGKFSAIQSWQVQVWVKEGRVWEGWRGRIRKCKDIRKECIPFSNSVILFLSLWSRTSWLTWTMTVKSAYNSHHYLLSAQQSQAMTVCTFIKRSAGVTCILNENPQL